MASAYAENHELIFHSNASAFDTKLHFVFVYLSLLWLWRCDAERMMHAVVECFCFNWNEFGVPCVYYLIVIYENGYDINEAHRDMMDYFHCHFANRWSFAGAI